MRLGSSWQWRRVCEQQAATDEEVNVWHLPALVQQHLACQQQQQQERQQRQTINIPYCQHNRISRHGRSEVWVTEVANNSLKELHKLSSYSLCITRSRPFTTTLHVTGCFGWRQGLTWLVCGLFHVTCQPVQLLDGRVAQAWQPAQHVNQPRHVSFTVQPAGLPARSSA
jgi:hypothetical protein